MNVIGTAVFGSPRGLQIESTGLFRNSDYESSTYPEYDHITLENNEECFLIRRFSDQGAGGNNSFTIQVILYGRAVQYLESRDGFIGSAIVFRNYAVDSTKAYKYLKSLYRQLVEANLDAQRKFKSGELNTTGVALKSEKELNALFDQQKIRLPAVPRSIIPSQKTLVQLNNPARDFATVLDAMMMLPSASRVEFCYLSSSNRVLAALKQNGFTPTRTLQFYTHEEELKQLQVLKGKEQEARQAYRTIENEYKNVTDLKKQREAEINNLSGEIESLRREKANAEIDYNSNKDLFVTQENEVRKIQHQYNQLKQAVKDTKLKEKDTLGKLKPQIDQLVAKHIGGMATHKKNVPVHRQLQLIDNKLDENKREIRQANAKSKKQSDKFFKLFLLACCFALLLLIGGVVGILWYEGKLDEKDQSIENTETRLNTKSSELRKTQSQNDTELLKNIQKYKLDGTNPDVYRLNEYTTKLAKLMYEDKASPDLKKASDKRSWQFYEFDYTNDEYVNKLSPKSKDTYFIKLDKDQITELVSKVKFRNDVDKAYSDYLKNDQNIYSLYNNEEALDSEIFKDHFEWMIIKENGNLEDLRKNTKLKLPYLKEKS